MGSLDILGFVMVPFFYMVTRWNLEGGGERHSEVTDPPGAVGYRGQLTVYPVVHLFPMIVSGPKAVMRFTSDPTSRM